MGIEVRRGHGRRVKQETWGPRMYQYDQYDQTIVDERVAQYADQVRRRLVGRIERRGVSSAAPAERSLHAAPRVHAPHRDSVRQPAQRPDARAGDHRARARSRLRPLFDAHEHPVQLDRTRGNAGNPAQARVGADARHPDLGQLYPQHHGRPVRGRRARRNRRSASVGRNSAPMVDVPPGIRVAAAQVQDRGERLRWKTARPCRSTISACT